MNKLNRLCTATVLTLALAFTAFAGDMQTPGITSTPPDQTTVTGIIDTPGVTTTDTSDSETPVIGSVTDAALYLLDSIASVL
jgi:hypothetical protein